VKNYLSSWATIRFSKRTLPRGISSWNSGFIPRMERAGCRTEYHVSLPSLITDLNAKYTGQWWSHLTVFKRMWLEFVAFSHSWCGVAFLGKESECIVGKPRTETRVPSRSCLRTALTTHWVHMCSQVHRVTSDRSTGRADLFRDIGIKTKPQFTNP
jgi:hypothetical protein